MKNKPKPNINNVHTDRCLMDFYPDTEKMRKEYGDDAADNYIVWNFKQRLGEHVDILSISVEYIASYTTLANGAKIPKKVYYMCTYEEIPIEENQ